MSTVESSDQGKVLPSYGGERKAARRHKVLPLFGIGQSDREPYLVHERSVTLQKTAFTVFRDESECTRCSGRCHDGPSLVPLVTGKRTRREGVELSRSIQPES